MSKFICLLISNYIFLHSETLKTYQMKNLTLETKTQIAVEMVILDAIEKGATNKNDIINFMKTETFEASVKGYVSLMK